MSWYSKRPSSVRLFCNQRASFRLSPVSEFPFYLRRYIRSVPILHWELSFALEQERCSARSTFWCPNRSISIATDEWIPHWRRGRSARPCSKWWCTIKRLINFFLMHQSAVRWICTIPTGDTNENRSQQTIPKSRNKLSWSNTWSEEKRKSERNVEMNERMHEERAFTPRMIRLSKWSIFVRLNFAFPLFRISFVSGPA